MNAAEHERFHDDVGAYLLGALEDDERALFERHAATCHVCQDEIDRLRVAADALPRSVEQYEAPPGLRQSLMDQVYAEMPKARRRSLAERLRLTVPRVAVAAACALVIGVVVGYAVAGGGGGGQQRITASVDTSRIGNAHATLVTGDGARLQVSGMPQLRRGQVYEVWLKRGERIAPGPLFSVDRNGNGAGAVPGDLDGVDAVMVTRERAGGAQQPTEVPVVVAKT